MLTQNFWLRANARRKNSPPPIPKSLMGEKDIEWLRSLVITVHQEFNHVWADVLNFADKRQKTLNEINEIKKLRWKVV